MDSAWVLAGVATGQFLIALLGAAIGVTWAMHNTENRLRNYVDKKQVEIRDDMRYVETRLESEIEKRADGFQTILEGLRLDIAGVNMYVRENIGRLNALIRNGNGK